MNAKRVTSQDVARLAGVSSTTVSFVFNDVPGQISAETRRRVLDAASLLGYVPDTAARALASGRSMTIGLLLARQSRMIRANMSLPGVLETLQREATRSGMRLLLEISSSSSNSQAYLNMVRSKSIDGMLYMGPPLKGESLQAMAAYNVPTVMLNAVPDAAACWVDIDNRAAARQAVDHLVALGHRAIACLVNPPSNYPTEKGRLLGYQEALQAAGLVYDPGLVQASRFTPESGYRAVRRLLGESRCFSAIFAASDVVACGAMKALREAGLRVPQDVSIVGFDDVPQAAYMEPPLTTVHMPVEAMTRYAFRMVLQLVRGVEPPSRHVIFETRLVERASTAPRQA